MERENENLKREIESQKKKRTVVRQLTTKLLSKIETNLFADVADGERKEILEDLKVQLEFKMSELRSLYEKIENHVPESEFENEITSSQEYQEKIVTVQGKIQRLLNRKLNSERRSEADNNETVIVKSSENRTMNLPRLQIETFYGDSCANVLWSITSSEIKGINKSCVAIETAFGWCLSGIFRNEEPLTCGFMNVTSQLTVDLDRSVKSFWELESIGMNETNDSSSESEKALQIFDSSIILKEKTLRNFASLERRKY
ncbi:uncharacterized protein TNCT_135901 [Trichonephila clavata]|uniref:Peptidase aspartic putative domain-containing protein n=1 Tax=Trichonephila clavata TaxID=2740835 RepID=A0A8X6J623_TRICU|nr:uncharacterized protein TNCT_135901 [Trichonephila clavata]